MGNDSNMAGGGATGLVRQVIGTVVDVEFPDGDLPEIYNAVNISMGANGETRTLVSEVQQHLGNNWVRCLALDSTDGLQRGASAEDTGGPITVPVGPATLGRIFNVLGEPLDPGEPIPADTVRRPIHRAPPAYAEQETEAQMPGDRHQGDRPDRPAPRAAARSASSAGRRRRQDRRQHRADPQPRHRARRPLRLRPAWASARARATTSGTRWRSPASLDKTALVFGQMNEPPGVRLRIGLTGLTMAEYFRDRRGAATWLLFIDNIYRYTLAGMEVSALPRPDALGGRLPADAGHRDR